jgi:hypothetical protein
MENITLEENELTPLVNFDANGRLMELNGRCIPEDAHSFFVPLITWISNLFETTNPDKNDEYHLIIKCDYFNSASAKMFVYLFDKCAEIQKSGYNLKISWQCHHDDPDLIDSVNDYADITGVNIDVHTI